jgi:hypothetical protein
VNGRGTEGGTGVERLPALGKDELERGEEILGEAEDVLVNGSEAEFGMLNGVERSKTFIVRRRGQKLMLYKRVRDTEAPKRVGRRGLWGYYIHRPVSRIYTNIKTTHSACRSPWNESRREQAVKLRAGNGSLDVAGRWVLQSTEKSKKGKGGALRVIDWCCLTGVDLPLIRE